MGKAYDGFSGQNELGSQIHQTGFPRFSGFEIIEDQRVE